MAKRNLTPEEQKKLLFGILGAMGLLAWMNLLILPQRRSLAEVRPQVSDLRTQIHQARQGIANLAGIQQELSRLSQEVTVPEASLPPEDQVPDLLKVVAQMARSTQVHLVEATPQMALGTMTPGASGYLELPIEVQAIGGYHSIGRFLDALESSEHLVRVQAIAIQPNEEDIWRHQVSLLLLAYLMPGPTPAAPPGSAQGAESGFFPPAEVGSPPGTGG